MTNTPQSGQFHFIVFTFEGFPFWMPSTDRPTGTLVRGKQEVLRLCLRSLSDTAFPAGSSTRSGTLALDFKGVSFRQSR